jgi:hypothetical protein
VNKNKTAVKATNVTVSEEVKPNENSGEIVSAMQIVHYNQSRLIILADQKANALIGMLTVVFTILFANIQHLSKLPVSGQIAFFGFLLMEVSGIIFALLVIFPKNISRKGPEKPEQMSNPLFFGAYTQFGEDEYVTCLMNRLISGVAARQLLLIDYYQVGIVLKQKYRQLRRAYILAVGGLVLLLPWLAAGILKTIVLGG